MTAKKPGLSYSIGTLLITGCVVLLYAAPGCPVALCVAALAAYALTAAAIAVIGKKPGMKVPFRRALPAGVAAGAGLMLLLRAAEENFLSTLLPLGFVPFFTGAGRAVLKKEPFSRARGIALAAVLCGAGLGLFFSLFSWQGFLAAGLFAFVQVLYTNRSGVPGIGSAVRESVSALIGALFTAYLCGESLSLQVLTLTPFLGAICLGAGVALCRTAGIKRETALWLRAAVPFFPLLFCGPYAPSDPALCTAFLLPAAGALFSKLSHAPGRYRGGEERLLLCDCVPVSFYNGVLCLRHPLARFTSGASFCFILLNANRGTDRRYYAGADTVKHEYGHILQAKALGVFRYWRYIALPSMRGYAKKVPYAEYYNQPWERGADALGGVHRYVHAEGSEQNWEAYFIHALPKRKRAAYIKNTESSDTE